MNNSEKIAASLVQVGLVIYINLWVWSTQPNWLSVCGLFTASYSFLGRIHDMIDQNELDYQKLFKKYNKWTSFSVMLTCAGLFYATL